MTRAPVARTSVLHQLAERDRLRIQRDGCGDPVVCGKHGEISEYNSDLLLACFHGIGAAPFNRTRAKRIKNTLALGHGERIQGGAGGDEASFAFSPDDACATAWFIKALELKHKRRVSAASLKALAKHRAAHFFRNQTTADGDTSTVIQGSISAPEEKGLR